MVVLCCLLFVDRCLLFVVCFCRSLLFVLFCSVVVVICLWIVVCCVLFVVDRCL